MVNRYTVAMNPIHCGGSHETPVASAAPADRESGRRSSMGPGLPTAAAMGPGRHVPTGGERCEQRPSDGGGHS